MRSDAIGLFWEDLPAVKPPKKEVIKRAPPEKVWERPDYLPGLKEALEFNVKEFTDIELACARGRTLIYDIECYVNYALFAFRDAETMQLVYFERDDERGIVPDFNKLYWVLTNFRIVTFNGTHYDIPITRIALAGASNLQLKLATNRIIGEGEKPYMVVRSMKGVKLPCDHIDIIEVAPLSATLKIYAGRIFAKRMSDLPFPHQSKLSLEQKQITKWYCIDSDIPATAKLFDDGLREQIKLREAMSGEYGIDLRSKSDAQLAEAVIKHEWTKMTGRQPRTIEIEPGTSFRFKMPGFIHFQTPYMKQLIDRVNSATYVVSEGGQIWVPHELAGLDIQIQKGLYRIGNGGLHSQEKGVFYRSTDKVKILDRDVASFYPRSILNQGMYPTALGPQFLEIYNSIVERRLRAKAAKDKVTSESLKITINGSYGKMGSPFSILYAPDLLIQTTITGQLALLMLIEAMELNDIQVISANTDGVVMLVPNKMTARYHEIVQWWEQQTRYETEETFYKWYGARDVNNYMALKVETDKHGNESESIKGKGAYTNPWAIKNNIWRLHKNPQNIICVEAIEQYLQFGKPMDKTIRDCKDIAKFSTVRTVGKGPEAGAAMNGEYLGKSVRWYYGKDIKDEIVYIKTGNKVSRSDGAVPIPVLPDSLPDNLDTDRYILEAEKMLAALGYT